MARTNRRNHVNGIESFWGYAKNRLVKFQGILWADFNLHLKECEFRFKMRQRNIYKYLLTEFRKLGKPISAIPIREIS